MTAATMIAILDYGAGNVASVVKAFRQVGATPHVTASAAHLDEAQGIVVPGVGHFQKTSAITQRLRDAVAAAMTRRTPVLGICLGLHWLFDGSDESIDTAGLGTFAGTCVPLVASASIKVPHVGWNVLARTARASTLLTGLSRDPYLYFCHSYAAPVGPDATAVSRHGEDFAAVVERDAVFGVQFHPEKSGPAGLRILQNFLDICEAAR